MKKLCRTEGSEAVICGVCGGLGKYLDIDPTVLRVVTAILILAAGLSVWVYIIAALVMPKESAVL